MLQELKYSGKKQSPSFISLYFSRWTLDVQNSVVFHLLTLGMKSGNDLHYRAADTSCSLYKPYSPSPFVFQFDLLSVVTVCSLKETLAVTNYEWISGATCSAECSRSVFMSTCFFFLLTVLIVFLTCCFNIICACVDIVYAERPVLYVFACRKQY